MRHIPPSDLILNQDGSVYHLKLLPGDLAETIITVGDPDRVPHVSRYFDSIELKKQKREFVTHTGYLGKKRISVISTGISTDNIDIVLNEIDALFNIDLHTRLVKTHTTSLKIIRIGTAGGLQGNIPLDTPVVSSFGLGLDGLLPFYDLHNTTQEQDLLRKISTHFAGSIPAHLYIAAADSALLKAFEASFISGITATCGGFYAPQGRLLRAKGKVDRLVQTLNTFQDGNLRFSNFEMETAGIYGMGRLLGHACCSLSTVVANRITEEFSKAPEEAVDKLIRESLSIIADLP